MKKPDDSKDIKDKSYNLVSEMNDLSSKSLLANVLDINDDFGIGGTKKYINRNSNRVNFKQQFNSNSIQYMTNNQVNLKRDNSNLSGNGADIFNDNKGDINSVRKNLSSILKEIRLITQKLKDDEEDEAKSLNWKFAAMVIDRLCLVVFSFATIFSTIFILFTSKNIFKPSDPHPIF